MKFIILWWWLNIYIYILFFSQETENVRNLSLASSTLVELTTRLDFFKERRSQLMEQLHNLDINNGTPHEFMYKPPSPRWNWEGFLKLAVTYQWFLYRFCTIKKKKKRIAKQFLIFLFLFSFCFFLPWIGWCR